MSIRKLPVLRAACAAALMMLARANCAEPLPDQILAFAGIEAGAKVADFMPGDGSLSRSLCTLVGETGRVYSISISRKEVADDQPLAMTCTNITSITLRVTKRPAPELWSSSDDPGAVYEYWSFTPAAETFAAPEPLDAIVFSDHYHGLHTAELGSPNVRLVNRALWNALKSGGVLLIEEAAAAIDAERVKRELLAAGFEIVGSNQTADRFVLKFRKP